MITRKQYMDKEATHRQYYAQFVNDQVKERVIDMFGVDLLLASKDEHLNDLPMAKWDRLGGFAFSGARMVMKPYNIYPVDINLIKEAGEGVSAATMCCIYKEAAKQIIEDRRAQ